MKKYIRAILDDIKKQTKPQPAAAPVLPTAVIPQDLNNQILSDDPAQRVRQLDYQAQKSEEQQTS